MLAWMSMLRYQPSLRMRLMLWMMLVFLLIQGSLSVVLYLYQRRSVEEFFDTRILAHYNVIASDLTELVPGLNNDSLQNYAADYGRFLPQRQLTINVYDTEGNPIATSQSPERLLSAEEWHAVREARLPVIYGRPGDGTSGTRVASGWLNADGHRYLLVVAWSDLYVAQMQQLFSEAVVFMILIGLAALLASAYALSGVIAAPFQAVRRLIIALDPENLGSPVPRPTRGAVELLEIDAELERIRARLEVAFTSQEHFMANVSHELKTPISVMLTEAQNLQRTDLPKDARAFLASIIEELDKLGRTIDSFLLLTRVRHGKSTIPHARPCTMRDIISESYESCAAMAALHRVRLVISFPPDDDDAAVHGNCDLLRTVVDNILRNAIRFSPPEEAVTLTMELRDGSVRLVVRDQGPGIPTDMLPRIFDRFAQSPQEQRRGRGHGLGLEIAHGIVALHGGTITAHNLPEKGCEFVVTFPLFEENTLWHARDRTPLSVPSDRAHSLFTNRR